jgi:beta-mannanase
MALDRYAARVGRMPRIAMWYQTWYGSQLVVRRVLRPVHRRGVTPMITWMPRTSPSTAAGLADIAAGAYDGYLAQAAADARAWGHRLLVRPFHEMNGRWEPWGFGVNGNTAADFVAAWRHVVSVFRANRATNVRFVFSPNVISANSPDFRPLYPGDRYVDRVALDGYNWGASTPSTTWRGFHRIFGRSYRILARLSSRRMLIAETASSERGGDKAAWIRHAFLRAMPRDFPRIRAVVWFNHRKETSWPVGSSRAALRAYRRVVAAE